LGHDSKHKRSTVPPKAGWLTPVGVVGLKKMEDFQLWDDWPLFNTLLDEIRIVKIIHYNYRWYKASVF